MWEWRNGQLMSDEDLERLWQMSEMQKAPNPPKTRYDVAIVWLLMGLGCGAFWAFVYWLYVRFR
jgi:hypothetical protein